MKNIIKKNIIIFGAIAVLIIIVGAVFVNDNKTITASSTPMEKLSTKKIEWGIKRNDNHEQPDVGAANRKVLEENGGICLGNKDKKYIYLTFDQGYEAGYTESILNTLKENEVHATFFITGHYLNTQEDLVKRMLEEGHLVRQSYYKPSFNPDFK